MSEEFNKEEYEKELMRYKKKELIAYLLKIREKTKDLRVAFELAVNPKTYREHDDSRRQNYNYLYFKFKAAIATYLGEKIQ